MSPKKENLLAGKAGNENSPDKLELYDKLIETIPKLERKGATMPYVLVPDALLQNTNKLKKYFDLSYEYVKTLKPKPTKRDKTAK